MKANKVTVVEEDSVPSLSRTEKNRLAALEKTISKGMETFLEVGRAIAAIHDEKLYRENYKTFAEYCNARWQMGRAHAYRMIDAVEVVEGLVKALGEEHPMPTNEAQIRILKKLDPEDRPEAWKRITEDNAYHEAKKQVTKSHESEDWSGVREIRVDETRTKKDHIYTTVVLDAATRKLLCMGKGHKSKAVGEFVKALKAHGGDPGQIRVVVGIDMSNAYQKDVRKYFPEAGIVFDRLNIMKMAGEAVDKICKRICEEHAGLKRHCWAFLGNNSRIQLAKQMARGFQNCSSFKAICFFTAGSLDPVVPSIKPQ